MKKKGRKLMKNKSIVFLLLALLTLSGCKLTSNSSSSDKATSTSEVTSENSNSTPTSNYSSDEYINSYDQYVYNYNSFIELKAAPLAIAKDEYSFQTLAIEFDTIINYQIVVSISNMGLPWRGIQSSGEGVCVIDEQQINIGYHFITYDYEITEKIVVDECVFTLDTENDEANSVIFYISYRGFNLNSIIFYTNNDGEGLQEIDYLHYLESNLIALTNDK